MKRCPFCAEEIQDAAVKCRHCGSMLTADAGAPVATATPPRVESAVNPATAPAVYALAQRPAAGADLAAPAIFGGTPSWKAWFWPYVAACVLAPVIVGLVWLAFLELRRRSTHYRISTRAIDVEHGVFSKRIETLQLWRVRDLQFNQSFIDRVFGIADIHVFTHDVTDPDLYIHGLPGSRDLFDQLRNAADLARQSRNVVGVVD